MLRPYPRVFWRLGWFSLPLILYLVVTLGLLLLGGELISLPQMAQRQKDDPNLLFGRAYHDDFRYYKFISTQLRSPDILALGSSRVMQFRAGMFTGGIETFYNAGGGASNIYEVRTFLEQLNPTALPKVLLLGLDQEWFEPVNAKLHRLGRPWRIQPESYYVLKLSDIFNTSQAFLRDVLNQKRPYERLLTRIDPIYHQPAFGIEAITIGAGFRSDGSYMYGPLLQPTTFVSSGLFGIPIATVLQRIQDGCCRFQHSNEVDTDALQELTNLVAFCQAHAIQLVAFLPPYAPTVYAEMQSAPNYGYIMQASSYLANLAQEQGFEFQDFTDGVALGTDAAFLDGFHGSEYIYTQMLIAMLQAENSPLRTYASIPALQNALQNAPAAPYVVFG